MSRRSSQSLLVPPAQLAHVVSVPAADASAAADSTLPPPLPHRWYPLHHLARWSGAVDVAAAAPLVKRAMAEARAGIEAHGAEQQQVHAAYRKIGQTMSDTHTR